MKESSHPPEELGEGKTNKDAAAEKSAEVSLRRESGCQKEQAEFNESLILDKQTNEQRRMLTATELETLAQRKKIDPDQIVSKTSQILGGRLGLNDNGKVLVADIGKEEIQTLKQDSQAAGSLEADKESNIAEPDEVIAQDWDKIKKFARDASETALERAGFFVRRGHEDSFVSYAAAREAHELAGLDRWGLPQNTIGAILRNEQHFFKSTDQDQDKQVRKNGTVLNADGTENTKASIGPAQMQIANIRNLINGRDDQGKPRFPYLQHMKGDPIREALKPSNAALLVGALLNDIASEQKAHGIEKPTLEQLVYGYNPDVDSYGQPRKYFSPVPGQVTAEKMLHKDLNVERYPLSAEIINHSVHVKNVMAQLAILDARDKKRR